MKLVPVSNDDLALFESMFCDPVHMADLGGPQPVEQVPKTLQNQVTYMESGKGWVYKIVPDAEEIPQGSALQPADIAGGVGTCGIWKGYWKDETVTEICWGVAPKFQGNKFAKKAINMILEMAVADGRWGTIHVFTAKTNVASCALCVSCGFAFQGEETIDYDGHDMLANHYTYETKRD